MQKKKRMAINLKIFDAKIYILVWAIKKVSDSQCVKRRNVLKARFSCCIIYPCTRDFYTDDFYTFDLLFEVTLSSRS